MASITDCVAEGLKYPFNDIKRLLGFGALFAILDLASLAFSLKAIDITRTITHALENTTAHLTTLPASQMPSGDICVAVGIVIFGFIVSLFIMGYQYDVIRLSIERKDDLPGFSDILAMFIKGVKYFIVAFA